MAGGDSVALLGDIGAGIIGGVPGSVQDFQNEQTVPLPAFGTFTGQWTYCGWSPTILSFYIAEYATNPQFQNPTVSIQWSPDGVNLAPSLFASSAQTVQFFPPSPTLTNGAYVVFNYNNTILWPYYRIQVVNGDQPQSIVFALQLLFGQQFPGSFSSLVGNTGTVALNTIGPPDFLTVGTLSTAWNGTTPKVAPTNSTIQQLGQLSGYQQVEWQFSLATGAAWAGSTINFEASTDGTNYYPMNAVKRGTHINYTSITSTTGGIGSYVALVGEAQNVRARLSSTNGTDSISCTMSIGTALSVLTTTGQIVGCTTTLGPTNFTLSFNSATQLDSTKLTNRKSIEVLSQATNNSVQGSTTTPFYVMVGFSNSVNATTGRMLAPGEAWILDLDETSSVWASGQASGQSPVVTVTQIGQ